VFPLFRMSEKSCWKRDAVYVVYVAHMNICVFVIVCIFCEKYPTFFIIIISLQFD
jgi:hypothetical protein